MAEIWNVLEFGDELMVNIKKKLVVFLQQLLEVPF